MSLNKAFFFTKFNLYLKSTYSQCQRCSASAFAAAQFHRRFKTDLFIPALRDPSLDFFPSLAYLRWKQRTARMRGYIVHEVIVEGFHVDLDELDGAQLRRRDMSTECHNSAGSLLPIYRRHAKQPNTQTSWHAAAAVF